MSLRSRVLAYALSVAIGLDVLLASILFGTRYQTVSEVSARASRDGKTWGVVLCALLDLADPNHCEKMLSGKSKE